MPKLNETERIILRIHRKLNEPPKKSDPKDYLSKAAIYTGLHPQTLKEIETGDLLINLENIDRSLVINALCRFYVRQRSDGGRLPTTNELFDAVIEMNKFTHMDISSFRKLLLKMGFIWKKVESQESVVVIEKPQVRFERFNYLTQIRKSRVEKYDDILFVDEVAYNQQMFMDVKTSRDFGKVTNGWQQRLIYAVGTKSVNCQKEIKEFNEAEFEDWILTDLYPSLAKPSVIVIKDIPHHNAMLYETPTLYTTKVELMDWLNHHNVPFSAEMSKYELYSLAEEYTDLETPLYKIDSILKARGHTLLRLPKCIEELSPAALLFRLIEKNWASGYFNLNLGAAGPRLKSVTKSCFNDVMTNSFKYLEGYTSAVVYNEQKMINMDKDVDKVLDALMVECVNTASSKYDSDVASCSDSE